MKLRLLYQKRFLLLFLIPFTYVCLILDTIKYPGFVGKHFLIDAKVYLSVCIVLMLISKTRNRFSKLVSTINSFIFAVSGFGYIYFSVIEANHYVNYVLSKFHFSLGGLVYVVLLSGAIFLAERLKRKKIINEEKIKFGNITAYFLIVYTLVAGMGVTVKNSIDGDIYAATHITDSYDEKMYFHWHDFYDYMVFVRNNTPENASIVIPPQHEPYWSRSGNLFLVRSFLYPRNIIQYGMEEIPDIKTLLPNTYLMIVWAEWGCDAGVCKGWPEQVIRVKEAIYKDSDSVGIKRIRQNFTFDPGDTNNSVGLLKI